MGLVSMVTFLGPGSTAYGDAAQLSHRGPADDSSAVTNLENTVRTPESGKKFTMEYVYPAPGIDYKIAEIVPDPTIDYKIIILEPNLRKTRSFKSSVPCPPASAAGWRSDVKK